MLEQDKPLSRLLLETLTFIEARPLWQKPYKELAYLLMNANFPTGTYSKDNKRFETIVDDTYLVCIYDDNRFSVFDLSRFQRRIYNPKIDVFHVGVKGEREIFGEWIKYDVLSKNRELLFQRTVLPLEPNLQ